MKGNERRKYEDFLEKAINKLALEYARGDDALQDRIMLIFCELAEAHGVRASTTLSWIEDASKSTAVSLPGRNERGTIAAPPSKTRLLLDYNFSAMTAIAKLAERSGKSFSSIVAALKRQGIYRRAKRLKEEDNEEW